MPRIEVRKRGPLLDPNTPAVLHATLRRWLQGVMRDAQTYARSISPVLTGRYRSSIRYRTEGQGSTVAGELYTNDIPGKVRVIEYGHAPRGPHGKGRQGRFVFARTYGRSHGLLATQGRFLNSELVRDLEG